MANDNVAQYKSEIELLSRNAGTGGAYNTIQQLFTQHDRFKCNNVSTGTELTGLTFITRPQLNLTSSNIKHSAILSVLNTLDVNSIQFAIRCLLDKRFASAQSRYSSECLLLVNKNPFMVPLCTALQSISGFPDMVMNTATTTGGHHGENQIYATGADDLMKNYDITMQFMDVQNSPLLNMFHYWYEFMRLVLKGEIVMYNEDIDAQRMCYTFSIYRFLMDPTSRYITGWAKATGCILTAVPMGAKFNVAANEVISQAAKSFSIPCSVNKIEYNDYRILMDFNRLVRMFNPNIESYSNYGYATDTNYSGVPYIGAKKEYIGDGYELLFKYAP